MKRILLLALFASVAGCTLGPQHPKADVPLPAPIASSTITSTAGGSQAIVSGAQVDRQWWEAFQSPDLNALVGRALAFNNDLSNAEATLRQAREQAAAAVGGSLPQVDASYQAQRIKTSRALSNPLQDPDEYLYTLHTAQLSVSYPLDIFGGGRSKIKSARAAAEVAQDKRDAARLTVIANLVSAVIQRASLDAQIVSAQMTIVSNRDILAMMRQREALGDIGAVDVSAQQTALATAEGALPPLVRQEDHQRSLIAMMIGVAPGLPLPELPTLEQLTLPATLPVALPADIVAHRPDVRAAEAQMRGSAADLGTAIAARFPAFQISGNIGGEATNFAQMFATGNPFWALIGGATQPLFHGGQLLHQERAARAALDGAKSQYRGAVLQAFSDVRDALTGLSTDAKALDAAARATDAADRYLTFTRRQLALGGVGTLALLNASASASQAHGQLVQARAARLTDSVALVQAVGGGPNPTSR